jgi:hypothetical protein
MSRGNVSLPAHNNSFRRITMKSLSIALLAATLFTGLAITGCETHHEESDKPRLLGGNTHEETTTTRNPVTGDTSTSHTETKTP